MRVESGNERAARGRRSGRGAAAARVMALLLAAAAPLAAQGAQPSPGEAASPGEADSTSAAAPARAASAAIPRSWTSDRREFRVGDIISVLLDEYTMASANKNEMAEQRRGRSLGASGSVDGTSLGTGSLDTNSGSSSTDRGAATRQNRLTGEMTVRVVEVDAAGLLRIEGTKSVKVDRTAQQLHLTGWLRPEDIPAHNTIESWRIADVQLEYESTGRDLSSPHSSMIGRLLGWLWP